MQLGLAVPAATASSSDSRTQAQARAALCGRVVGCALPAPTPPSTAAAVAAAAPTPAVLAAMARLPCGGTTERVRYLAQSCHAARTNYAAFYSIIDVPKERQSVTFPPGLRTQRGAGTPAQEIAVPEHRSKTRPNCPVKASADKGGYSVRRYVQRVLKSKPLLGSLDVARHAVREHAPAGVDALAGRDSLHSDHCYRRASPTDI